MNKEQREKSFNKVLDKIAEKKANDEEGTRGIITVDTLETLTQDDLNEEYVISLNEALTEMYKHIVVSYGFKDFHSLYLFALSNTQEETMKAVPKGNKDFSKLNKVRRTVVRNGRRTTMTFYEDPKSKGTDNKQKVRAERGGDSPEDQVSEARELNIIASGDFEEPIPIKELQAAQELTEGFIAVGDFKDLDRIKLYLNEYTLPKAIQGLRIEREYLTMPYYATDGNVQGFYQRAFFELVKVAMNLELGIKLEEDDTKIQRILAETSELDLKNGRYIATYDELLNSFGELP